MNNFYTLIVFFSHPEIINSCYFLFFLRNMEQIKNIYYITVSRLNLKKWTLIAYYKIRSKNELKEIDFKNYTCYFFNDIIKIVDFYFDNILLVKKAKKNIFLMTFPTKRFLVQNHCLLDLMK